MPEEIKDSVMFKEAVKEGIQEWLNAQFTAFGRWTFYGLLSLAMGGLVYFALTGLGWKK
ncbi:hypothetical protein [Cupriavidus metallidurans]|jgi:hypothetical protein|uniref:hypothetical protein n=1 Tax=Cupriavidus metallidurans TaxID=119219 RepID=UPI00167A7AE4|nr:hypothetical protein [Cupriavidus metallidurans]QWC87498.1 hypothetical protein KB891_10560 [Cupriavidus metallidurans]